MRGLNLFQVIGRLGVDPVVRAASNGTKVVNFNLAINERKKVDGEWKDHTEWINVVCFGKMADTATLFLEKGMAVYLMGHIQTRKWGVEGGAYRQMTELVVEDMRFLDKTKRKPTQEEGGPKGMKSRPLPQQPADDDDVPF